MENPLKLIGKIGETGDASAYKKDPKGTVGFWLMTALAAVLGLLLTIVWINNRAANSRADEAEKNVVIERAKRDADNENSTKRVEYWINKAIETIKESAKKEQLQELNK